MIELSPETAIDYLQRAGLIAGDVPAQVEVLSGGVSNAVIRIDTPARSMVLKQARARLRTPEAWFSRLDRAWRECDAMRLLGAILGPATVPEILWEDRANYA